MDICNCKYNIYNSRENILAVSVCFSCECLLTLNHILFESSDFGVHNKKSSLKHKIYKSFKKNVKSEVIIESLKEQKKKEKSGQFGLFLFYFRFCIHTNIYSYMNK